MQSIPEGHSHRTRIEDEFKNLLPKWTRRVACQNECRPPESCSCRREIVHVHALEAWWNKPASDGVKETKAHYFLEEMGPSSHRIFPLKHQKLFTGEQSCLRVISLLIAQNRSHLIDSFYGADMNDRYLVRSESYLNLREKLLEIKTLKQEQVNGIVEDFHKDKWAYCPMNLTLDMDANLHGTQVIPPFCYKIRLGDKGGTASIYWVAVQKDLISDEALACALQKSLYYDEYYGECYQMVLKSYCGNKRADFELEKHAFSGLDSREDVPIVQYLGSYTHDYGEGQNMGKTYNLLLEYGEWDLYQAWADETNVPPVRAREILRTWDSVFEIAKAIRHVHHPVLPRGGTSEPLRFHGWHADIKPDNILSIRGKLKLADFGFSSFAPAMEGEDRSVPTKLIRGFTDTYGAPELYRMKGPDGSLSGVPQTIDMWSFGCVLSVTATWIVLGFQGVKQYEQVRQFSPANRKYEDPSDRFHDGSDVLPEIRKWHDFLRGHLRPSDTTTTEVLTLIENNLLKANSEDRPDSEELCKMLERVHNVAESQISNLPKHSKEADDVVLRALAEMEKRAQNQKPQDTKAKSNRLQLAIPSVGISQVNPRQRASMQFQKKEVIKSKPLGQTAYRQEILKEELGTSDIGLSVTNPPFQGHPKFIEQIASTVPPFMNRQSVPQLPSTSRPYTPESMVTESNTPTKHQAWTRSVAQSGIPKLEISAPEDSILGDRQVDEPASATASQTNISPSSELTIQLGPVDTKIAKGYMESYPDKFPDGKQAVGERSATPLESRDSVNLPSSVLDLPYNICAKRKALDMEKSKGIWKFAGKMGVGKMGVETRKQDSSLAGTFSDHHELVFVIDNGCTMFGHWPILTFVVETLALNAAGIDKSGIDLRFTVDGYMHDKQRLKGDSGRQVLKKSLIDAWPEHHQEGNTTTDMTSILRSIYKNWNRENRPATTLYVFTDGMWTHRDPSALHKAILDFARLDKRMTGKRHFSIQFIRFGDNEQAKEQLQYFDDTLCKKNGLRDIIDHCSWRAPVNKIFKGSIEGFHDEHEDDDPPVVYDYKALAEKFNRFNSGKESSEEKSQEPTRTGLNPFSSRARSTSQFSSQASLNMLPRNRDSFATDMSISKSKRNSRGPSFFP